MIETPNELAKSNGIAWRRVLLAEAMLLGALTLVLSCVAYFAVQRSGSAGLSAAVVAFSVCWLPNAISLIVMGLMADPQQSVSGMLMSMLLRMGIPLVLVVVLSQNRHWLIDVGVLPMIVVFYLTALVIDTLLSLWISGASRRRLVNAS